MLSAHAEASDRAAMDGAGATRSLTEPSSPIGLAALVGEVPGT